IAEKDIDLLKSLPEIGKRTAETIVVELNGKVDRFIEMKPQATGGKATTIEDARSRLIHDTVTIMAQLGEPKLTARQLVERAVNADPASDNAEALLAAAYRLKDLG